MKINKQFSTDKYDAWECGCGTITPVSKGSPKPVCEYCRRVKEYDAKQEEKKTSKMIYYEDGRSHFECKKCGITSDGGTVCQHFLDGDVEIIGERKVKKNED
jgi:hypothetical protein